MVKEKSIKKLLLKNGNGQGEDNLDFNWQETSLEKYMKGRLEPIKMGVDQSDRCRQEVEEELSDRQRWRL